MFGKELSEMAKEDEKICAITAAMADGTGLLQFSEEHPERFFDVGIAEEHALTFAAGLAAAGMKPYFAVYSTFLQRGYDNLLHDIALQKLPVRVCVDRAGLATSDGATHHGIFDVAFASHIPEFEIYSPVTFSSMRRILHDTQECNTPVLIRYSNCEEIEEVARDFYPNGEYTACGVHSDFEANSDIDTVIITYGKIVKEAIKAKLALESKGKRVGIILAEKLKPYANFAKLVSEMLPSQCRVVFLEEGIYYGGAGMLLREELMRLPDFDFNTAISDFKIFAVDDNFAIPEEKTSHYKWCNISSDDVVDYIMKK